MPSPTPSPTEAALLEPDAGGAVELVMLPGGARVVVPVEGGAGAGMGVGPAFVHDVTLKLSCPNTDWHLPSSTVEMGSSISVLSPFGHGANEPEQLANR